jgi:hypothetical protein
LKRRGRRHATISLWPFGKVRRAAGCSISFVSFCNVHFKQPHFSNSASPVGLSHSYYQDVLSNDKMTFRGSKLQVLLSAVGLGQL